MSVQQLVQANKTKTTKLRITGPLLGEPTVTGDSPHKGPLMSSFGVSFDINLNKLLDEQPSCRLSETPWHSRGEIVIR